MNIQYVSSSLSPSGYASAARADICALFCAGVNLTCDSIQQTAESSDYGLEGSINKYLEKRDIPYKAKIVHLTPDLYPTYIEKGVYTIGRLAWETDKLPKEWIEPLNSIDEIWTMSGQMAEMIHRSGVTTLCTVIPEPIYAQKAQEKIEPFRLQEKDFVFYSIGQWIDRKNFRGLLRAYWKAFQDEKVSLLIKTYRFNYSESEYLKIKEDIQSWKAELKQDKFPKVLLLRNLLTDAQIDKLHGLGDVYVSPSSGEGWNRPMMEAMLYGKPCISGDNGGITDIMTTADYFVVPSKSYASTEVSQIPWYTSDMKIKMLDEDALSKQMQFVFNNYDKALERGKKAQDYVVENFSFQEVGKQMYDRLREIYINL